MVETLAAKRAQSTGVRLTSLPDILGGTDLTESILLEAMQFCSRKIRVDSLEAVAKLLRQNDRTACEYCLYSMAKSLAASLGAVDENVRAVYVLDYDATPEDLCFGTLNKGRPLVHLIVWAKRKTAALGSLVAVLDRALAQAYTDLVGGCQVEALLDVQVVDDADVKHRTGHGALLQSIHHPPVQIWERQTG